MWITFKSCIFAFWNNEELWKYGFIDVVNYIQILYLCILKQLGFVKASSPERCELHSNLVSLHSETTYYKRKLWTSGCELHSNLVSLHSETTKINSYWSSRTLWITFKSCIFAFWNNGRSLHSFHHCVVNYIQILYLCILKQHNTIDNIRNESCELHSNLVSLHSETTYYKRKLWTSGCELHSNLVSLHSETTRFLTTLKP